MAVSPWWYPRVKAHPLAYDYAIVVLLVAVNLLQPGTKHDGTQIDLTVIETILILVACLPLAVRRKAPLAVLTIITLATISYAAYVQVKSPIGLALACATYTVVSQKGRQTPFVQCPAG